jgi:hypothetical protein
MLKFSRDQSADGAWLQMALNWPRRASRARLPTLSAFVIDWAE